MDNLIIPPALGILGMVMAFVVYKLVMKYPDGEDNVKKIGDQIHAGALAFMKTEYKYLSIFIAVIVLLAWYALGPYTAISIVVGAICSSVAGFIGMYAATKANVRTATAAQKDGPAAALSVSFYGGSIMGLCVASLGLIGLGGLYYFYIPAEIDPHKLEGFAMGASVVALFSRVGGGIFTKSADVGADLVGKIEAGIPEDDPRNPGVIADNVGDNVGDVAGMGSDIFESYCGSMIASIAIAYTLGNQDMMLLPLVLAATGLIASIIGIFIVKLQSAKAPASALRSGTLLAPVIFVAMAYFIIDSFDGVVMNVWWCVIAGAVGGVLIGLITEYYTGGGPVKKIAESGETGSATVMISGLSLGMQSVVIPIVILAGIILTSTQLSGIYGVGIAAVGMLATVGITMAIDAYGPVADNAGGIAEMSGMGEEVREITDSLDELGNTTAAIGKGFAIGAAALAALAIISAFSAVVGVANPEFSLALTEPIVLVGMFIGVCIPFLVSSITMTAVGDAAFEMINEIRRQFKEISGLMEGTAEPDSEKCVEIATKAALKKMMLPGVIAVSMPAIVGFGLGAQALGGMLAGGLLGCVSLALMMANAGGAWDNAKKYVEKGNLGGKGSDTHAAAVVGDTVGDPFKDTSGPSMNILINVMAIVSLVIAPLLSI
ncbi:MAG: sodium-translocating pyrophosphatase [SAR86 cluster bacterium]|jgi:K(+)-stimulated pyrophosphate-energized sodium pump|uniref:Putative K(+)-stimulated pyrophosphate-energized sodium pump n=1 Tax=SAR86 cluster bacterium TaxID=2030880 RepID=A0A520N2J6_9GAMM|nr:MAG: sodium-translocating pyrophosphatase [SAR86 cluster bacterium]|tara:strand:+ start:1440 stop:3422 length:1983 start_codon:yes stop_codon:yes gene_type:complete